MMQMKKLRLREVKWLASSPRIQWQSRPLDSNPAEHRIWALGHWASASSFNTGLQRLES